MYVADLKIEMEKVNHNEDDDGEMTKMAMMIMITMMMMTTVMMITNSVYWPVEASDGVIMFRPLILRNTQTHLKTMITMTMLITIIMVMMIMITMIMIKMIMNTMMLTKLLPLI